MTGVPRSQGCNGCRKQKKKCDQAQPACSRCARLRIPCVGAGEKRYKFVEVAASPDAAAMVTIETANKTFSIGPITTTTSAAADSAARIAVRSRGVAAAAVATAGRGAGGRVGADPLSLVPASRTTRIAGSFVNRLEIRDVRYDISSYGNFLRQLPRRAHTNEALEAAMDAFDAAFSGPSNQQGAVLRLRKYGAALKALRVCLRDPAKAITVETLCAVYLVMLVQSRIGKPNEQLVSHEQALAALLDSIAERGINGCFETEAIAVISVPLLYSSMTNSKIRLNSTLQKIMLRNEALHHSLLSPTTFGKDPLRHSGFASLQLTNMIKIPDFLNEPERHLDDMRSTYDLAKDDVATLAGKLSQFNATGDGPETPRGRLRRDHQAAYGMASAVVVAISQILQGFDPLDPELPRESARHVASILDLATEATVFAPFGSGCMAGPLAISWGATITEHQDDDQDGDAETRTRLRTLLQGHYESFRNEEWARMAEWWRYKFMQIRVRLGNPRPGDDGARAEEEVQKSVSFVQCSASHNYIEISFAG